mgnify:CR=1 FL=1
MYDIFIKNGEVVLPENRKQKLNIGIKNNIISLITTKNDYSCKTVIDAKNLTIIPGVIDSQVHFREPGSVHKEDLETGSKSAALGGVTSIFEMPNTSPPTSTPELLEEKLKLAKNRMWTNYAFFAGATANNINLIDKLELMEGCAGIKIFMGSSTGNLLVPDDETLTKILNKGFRRIAIHAEDENRLQNRKKLIKKGSNHSFHPIWRDETCAINATKRIIKIVKKIKRPIHILHVSTSEEIELLKKQKKIITVEVTPQHLTLSAPNCYNTLGALAQMNPPIRTINHQEALWKGIKDGVVDVIGSDHAPHTLEEKNRPYPDCPSGMPGVQTMLPIMLDHVNKGKLSLHRLVELVCSNPAKIYKVNNKGHIKLGYDADISIIDLNKKYTITNDIMRSKCGWTPFHNKKITGWPIMTIINGRLVMKEGSLLGKPAGTPVKFSP